MTGAVLFAKAVVLGIVIAAPLGPIGALCIARTLERGFFAGVAGGLGTALADATYATLAALGFTAFAATLEVMDLPLRLAGGAFMLWLGWQGLRARPAAPTAGAPVVRRDLLGTAAVTFMLTIANPATILSFAALFAGLGLAASAGAGSAVLVVAGVFAGSIIWWLALSGAIALSRHRLSDGFAQWISFVSGVLLMGFGLWAVARALR